MSLQHESSSTKDERWGVPHMPFPEIYRRGSHAPDDLQLRYVTSRIKTEQYYVEIDQ
jgi:hypothetical protein